MKGSSNNHAAPYLFTSESVTMGHPDKVADAISDAVVDSLLARDPMARIACETLVTTGLVVISGEVTVHNQASIEALNNVEETARRTIQRIGYTDPALRFDYQSCAVVRSLHSQSADISQGVDETAAHEQGAGDQGLMFGFACREASEHMPMPIYLSHRLVERLAEARMDGEIDWLKPDGKSQVTVEYRDGKPHRVHTIVISTQHEERKELLDRRGNCNEKFRKIIIDKIIKPVVMREAKHLWHKGVVFHINPTGRFVIGGPHGDTGLTGRKIIVDTYGGRAPHGGGAFSGKDPSKVDRSASYMARYIAKNIVAAGLADQCQVQLAYAIGIAKPVSVLVTTAGTGKVREDILSELVQDHFQLTPRGIIDSLKLRRPIYEETAAHGHFGRPGFSWEATDKAAGLKKSAARWLRG
ncbi:MAG: methionine adenosyltransferase [Phycisphaerae bacterium]